MAALDLSDTAVTSAGMATVARMRRLHTLSLSFGGAPRHLRPHVSGACVMP